MRKLLETTAILTVMGEHVRPIRTSTPWTTTPKSPSSLAIAGSLVVPVVSQHWRSPVEQDDAGSLGMGVAAARSATERKIASLENIFA